MCKGKLKRKSGQFKQGNKYWKIGEQIQHQIQNIENGIERMSKFVRLPENEFNLVAKEQDGIYTAYDPSCEKVADSISFLRPAKVESLATSEIEKSIESKKKSDGMRLVELSKVVEAFNWTYAQHEELSPNCIKLEMAIYKEIKWGLGWKITLCCKCCKFTGKEFKLYEEIITNRPGQNAAAINVGLGVGLQDTPLGNKRARLLFAAMDTPPPARSSMQRTANRVGSAVVSINKADMEDKLRQVKKVSAMRGSDPNMINISMDGRYNSVSITSRKKPGQNASQAIGIAVETISNKKLIVGASIQNKLCWMGSWLRGQGYDIKCPEGHAGCTANLPSYSPLSEYSMGKDIATELFAQGSTVKYVTTDGDSKSSEGVKEALRILKPMWQVERHADPTHLGQLQFKKCMNATFSQQMFPGCSTKEEKKNAQKVFSQDVKARCSLVLKELMKTNAGDMNFLRSKLPKVLEATLLCYCGDCSKCYRNGVVCSGGVTNNWFNRSIFLASHKITVLHLNDNDACLLLEILKFRLSVEAVEKVKFYTDTQKCEAVNRSLSVSMPKNVNFSRNVYGRTSSTIHRVNNGTGLSVYLKCKKLGVNLSHRSKKALEGIDREEKCAKEYAKCSSVVKHKLNNNARRIREHIKYRSKHHAQISDYKKGLVDHPYSA